MQSDEATYLELQINSIIFNKSEVRVATFRDVTESKKLAKAEASSKLNSLFTSSVTHELVTPLKCMISFADTL